MNDIIPPNLPPTREQIEYNRLFELLVASSPDDEPRLIGFIAYVYYKIAKREWVADFYKKESRHPSDVEMRAYTSTWTDTRIDGLKTEANTALSQFSSFVVAQEKPDIEKAALQHVSFWRDAFVAFCGALMYSLALILFALILRYFDIDILHVFSTVKSN